MWVFRQSLIQLLAYGLVTWTVFVLITVFASSLGAARGLILGQCVIAGIVLVLDVQWVQAQIARPAYNPNTGPDLDAAFLIVFPIGVLVRVVMINALLLPLGWTCVWLAYRRASRRVA